MTIKEQLKELIDAQPEDATYDEILRELAFRKMIEQGLSDVRKGRSISNQEMADRIQQRQLYAGLRKPLYGWNGFTHNCAGQS